MSATKLNEIRGGIVGAVLYLKTVTSKYRFMSAGLANTINVHEVHKTDQPRGLVVGVSDY